MTFKPSDFRQILPEIGHLSGKIFCNLLIYKEKKNKKFCAKYFAMSQKCCNFAVSKRGEGSTPICYLTKKNQRIMKTRVELAKAGIELLKARDENTESFNDREISYDEWAAKDASFAKKMAGWRRSYISYKSKTTGASCDEISIAYASTITERIIREIQY